MPLSSSLWWTMYIVFLEGKEVGFNRLGTRIVALVVGFLIISVGIIAVGSVRISSRGLTNMSIYYESAVAKENAENLNGVFMEFTQAVRDIQNNVAAYFDKSDMASIPSQWSAFTSDISLILQLLAEDFPHVRQVFITLNPEVLKTQMICDLTLSRKDAKSSFKSIEDSESITNLLNRNNPETEWFWGALDSKKPVWGDPQEANGMYVMTLSMPVLKDGKVFAVVGMDFDAQFIPDKLREEKIYDTGYVWLLNEEGNFLYHPVEAFMGKGLDEIENGYYAQYWDQIKREPQGRFKSKLRGDIIAVSYATLPNGMVLGTQASASEALAPVAALKKATLLIAVVVLFVAIIITSWVIRKMTKPLQDVAKKALYITENSDLSVRLETDSKIVEIRAIVDALNAMVVGISGIVSAIVRSSKTVLNKAEDMSAASEESAAAVEQVSELVKQSEMKTQDSAAATQQANAGIQEVAAAAQTGAKAASEAGESAVNIANAAERGGDAVRKMSTLIDETSTAGGNVGQAIRLLADTVEKISSFVSTITAIADQTNLLALNAAIEAARAGDAGRGFAVVAEEVRKLAEESAKSAEEVNHVIIEISERSRKALTDQEGAEKYMVQLVQEAKETKDIIDHVVVQVAQVSDHVQSIAATMEEQSASAEEMTAGMDSVARTGQEISDQMKQITQATEDQAKVTESIAQSAEEMVTLSRAMEDAVARFKLEEEEKSLATL